MRSPSPETLLLVKLLKDCYEQNQMALYSNVREISQKRHHLSRALQMVKLDYGYCFNNCRNVGYQPIANPDKVKAIAQKRHNKIKNQVGYWQEEWQTIDSTDFDPVLYKEYLFNSVRLATYQTITSLDRDTKIREGVEEMTRQSMVRCDKSAIAALIDVS